jgi:PEP-CTERM motif
MRIRYVLNGAIIALSIAAASTAEAAVVTTLPNGTAIPIPGVDLLTSGPVTFGPVTLTSNVTNKFGWTSNYDFGNNGSWTGTPPLIGLNAASSGPDYASMNFTFDAPTSGFLADLNWDFNQTNGLTVYLQVFDSNGSQLENGLALTVNNGGQNNVGPGFWGFSRAQADIKSFRLSNGFVALRNLSYVAPTVAAVPEPTTWTMIIAGFGIVGAGLRRRSAGPKLQLV